MSIMIRLFIVLYLILSPLTIYAQVYEVELRNLENITLQEKEKIRSLINSQSVSVYVFSKLTDSLFLKMINEYRQAQPVPMARLEFSVRLDTLAVIVAKTIGESGKLAHYPAFPELHYISDLLNIENIAYNASNEGFNRTSFADNTDSYDIVNIGNMFNGWVKSPGHNRNMLADVSIGVAKILLRITQHGSSYILETIGIFEGDYKSSKREAKEKLNELNNELIKRPVRIQRNSKQ